MKSVFKILLFFFVVFQTTAQVSFFKDLNQLNDGSNPSDFEEVNGVTYFTTKTIEGYRLWKTDGTEVGTVLVTEKPLFQSNYSSTKLFYAGENKVFYWVQDFSVSGNQIQLWKYDGSSNTQILFSDSLPMFDKIIELNGNILFFTDNLWIRKLNSDGTVTTITPIGFNPPMNYSPIKLNNNELICFDNYNGLKVWKIDAQLNFNLLRNV